MTTEQQNYLRELACQPNNSIEEITSNYLIWKGALYNLRQGREYNSDHARSKIKLIYQPLIRVLSKLIKDYVEKSDVQIKAKDIQRMIFRSCSIEIATSLIIYLMKNELNLSYK